MNILIIGSGGREHALAWKIKQSPLVEKLYCSPANAGIAQVAEVVELKDHAAIVNFAKAANIALVVIGPEVPLVEGLADKLRAENIPTFGPSANAAQLEGSKGFTKDLCKEFNIPTAAYARFDALEPALAYAAKHPLPVVLKADGLAAGKGVMIPTTHEEAAENLREIFGGKFGAAGASVVIEEFMEGEELSFFALADGEHALAFGAAQDHKRVGEGDTGPNTGGMGTYALDELLPQALEDTIMQSIIAPTMAGMKARGMPFQGVLFAGLMLTKDGPKLIEYNARFGDPETQSLMLRLESDVVPYLLASANGTLASMPKPTIAKDAVICVVMAANGYPDAYEKNTVIRGLEKAATLPDVQIFHAGTAEKNGEILAIGGRALNVCARAKTLKEAQGKAYAAIDTIDWPQGFCRRDIGWRRA